MNPAATFAPVVGSSVNLRGTGYRLQAIDQAYEYEGAELPKQQDSGQHPAHVFVRRMVLTVRGTIIGTSESDYWSKRGALIAALVVADGAQTYYHHGTLTVTPASGSAIHADVVVTGLDLPLEWDEGVANVSRYTATMRNNRGYWLNSSNAVVYY